MPDELYFYGRGDGVNEPPIDQYLPAGFTLADVREVVILANKSVYRNEALRKLTALLKEKNDAQ